MIRTRSDLYPSPPVAALMADAEDVFSTGRLQRAHARAMTRHERRNGYRVGRPRDVALPDVALSVLPASVRSCGRRDARVGRRRDLPASRVNGVVGAAVVAMCPRTAGPGCGRP